MARTSWTSSCPATPTSGASSPRAPAGELPARDVVAHPCERRGARRGRSLGMTVALGLLAGACSDATVSRASYDRPLFAFTGRFNPVATVGVSSLKVGVVWIDPLQVHDDLPAPPETMRFEATPSGYTLSFFAPPPASVIYAVDHPKTETLLTRF